MKKEIMQFIGSIGCGVACALSWITNHSIGWAITHFLCGWLYVIWNLIVYGMPHLPVR